MKISLIPSLAAAGLASVMAMNADDKPVRWMTLDPGHFHAALVQKSMYPQVDPVVHVYSQPGPDLDLHLARIEAFNTRAENPTSWQTKVYRGDDSLAKMLAEKPGNVVVLSGNNARKTKMILTSVEAGLNVLADKPMAITPADFDLLRKAFQVAEEKGVLLYDIMTERFEITTMLQRELSLIPEIFGSQAEGSPEKPAITKESVHHYFKFVSGKPLQRPWWFFDVTAQGEGIVDVTTHLVDLVQWELYPGTILKESDVEMLSARTWPTKVTLDQFKKATGLDAFPPELKDKVNAEGVLEVMANGEFTYKLRGVCCKVSVVWNYEAPEGAKDTHYSIMQGSRCALVIRQGADEKYLSTLFVEPVGKTGDFGGDLDKAISKLAKKWPGLATKPSKNGWEIVIPDEYKLGHEAHFSQVAEAYLGYLKEGKLPAWEVPNMLIKYHTLMQAYRMSR